MFVNFWVVMALAYFSAKPWHLLFSQKRFSDSWICCRGGFLINNGVVKQHHQIFGDRNKNIWSDCKKKNVVSYKKLCISYMNPKNSHIVNPKFRFSYVQCPSCIKWDSRAALMATQQIWVKWVTTMTANQRSNGFALKRT